MIDYDERWRRRYNASLRRQDLKLRAIEYKGGHCALCDYDKCPSAMVFHHRNPREKDFCISAKSSWSEIVIELDKCDLLCANCHAEVHAGYHPSFWLEDTLDQEEWHNFQAYPEDMPNS